MFDTRRWVRWFFTWLTSDEHWKEAIFGHRLPKKLRDELVQSAPLGGSLADTVWGWMSGETLIALNQRRGGNPSKPGKCDLARKFVLKMIPNLAFAAGLLTRIRRGQIDEDGGIMPLSLATLALCIREGLREPELAALKTTLISRPLSRAAINALWDKIKTFAPERTEDETFSATRKRVSTALLAARARGIDIS